MIRLWKKQSREYASIQMRFVARNALVIKPYREVQMKGLTFSSTNCACGCVCVCVCVRERERERVIHKTCEENPDGKMNKFRKLLMSYS